MEILDHRTGAAAECALATPATVSLDVGPGPPPFLPLIVPAVRTFRDLAPGLNLSNRLSLAPDFCDPTSGILNLCWREVIQMLDQLPEFVWSHRPVMNLLRAADVKLQANWEKRPAAEYVPGE